MLAFAALLCFALAPCQAPSDDAATARERPLWLVVTTEALAPALEPLVAAREAGGLEARVSTEGVEAALAAAPRAPSYLLLVGDTQRVGEPDPSWNVPTNERPLYRWIASQRRTFESDAAWGDLDDDATPDVPVGRIPARTPDEVERAVKKILAFEARPFTPQDLRLVVWGGSPDYGPEFDRASTALLLDSMQRGAPRWSGLWLLTGDAQSPLCGWPADQPARFAAEMGRGGLLDVLMGHGNALLFHSMSTDTDSVDLTAPGVHEAFGEGEPTPPMVVFACDCGDFARKGSCLAEELLARPAGPVAVIAATTNSHPLTNYFTSTSLLESIVQGHARLGDLWQDAQERALKRRLGFLTIVANQLKDVEGKLEPEIDVAGLQRDQFLMYALLGDPATRLRFPTGTLSIETGAGGSGRTWRVAKPANAGPLLVAFRPAARPALTGPADQSGREAASRLLEEAGAELGFVPRATLEPDAPWEGTLDAPGTLRVVTTTDDGLLVGVVEVH